MCRVALHGELDLSNADDLRSLVVDAPHADGVERVAVDLGEVSFLDSTAISALIAGYQSAGAAGVGFAVTGAQGYVEKVLQVAGVLGLLRGDPPE